MADEFSETSQERFSVSPELGSKLTEAKAGVVSEMQKPETGVATGTEQMGLLASLGGLYKEIFKKRLWIAFKDVKAALSIIPFVPLASEALTASKGIMKAESLATRVDKAIVAEAKVAKAGKAATKAERWAKWFKRSEGAKRKYQAATVELGKATREAQKATQAATVGLERGRAALGTAAKEGEVSQFVRKKMVHDIKDIDYVVNYDKAMQGTRKLTETEAILRAAGRELPARNLAEKVGKRAVAAGKFGILRTLGPIIDPAPDVPGVVILGSIGAEFLGFPLAAVVTPIWQYVHNRYEELKLGWETSMKAKDIIKAHFEKRLTTMKEPQVAKAAAVFA